MLQSFGVPQEVLLCGGTPLTSGLLSRVDLARVSVAVHRGSFRGGVPSDPGIGTSAFCSPSPNTGLSSPLSDGFFPSYSRW